MKNLFCLLFLALSMSVTAQVAINTDGSLPDNSAMLDVKSTEKGMLFPRMTLAQRNAIASPAPGLTVFQTDNTPGYYFNSGTSGSPIWSIVGSGSGWSITGNSGTNPTTNFIGTTDAQPLMFKVYDQKAGYIDYASPYNTCFGYQTLWQITTGTCNTATGNHALFANTSGSWNAANGFQALYLNTTGNNNTANGWNALRENTEGSYNTANGEAALYWNTTGNRNSASGANALFQNTTGSWNTACGESALSYNTIGSYNTGNGMGALNNNTTGSFNTACGTQSLATINGGSENTAVGYLSGTLWTFPNLNNTIGIGNNGHLIGISNQAFIGNLSTSWNGGNVTWSTYSDARVKNNVQEDVKGLDFITRLRPVTYYRSIKAMTEITGNKETADYPEKYDIEKIKFSGFLAQDVEQAAREANYDFSGITMPKSTKELYTLSYEQFVVPLVKAVQELNAINESQKITNEKQKLAIEEQKLAIEELKTQNEQLMQRIEKLETK
jgi:hypothetical protein